MSTRADPALEDPAILRALVLGNVFLHHSCGVALLVSKVSGNEVRNAKPWTALGARAMPPCRCSGRGQG
eukprot:15480198-Alexandrium_andersonii.AAC.1